MSSGEDRISNLKIEKLIKKSDNEHLKRNFLGVYPSNHINKFVEFHKLMVKKAQYPYLILNTDRSYKPGTYWWSIIDIHLKKSIFLFDSFGIIGLCNFIIQNDESIVKKTLHRIKKMIQTGNKITIVKKKFSRLIYYRLNDKKKKINIE